MRTIERVTICCHTQEDLIGNDDILVTLDGHEIGRLTIHNRGGMFSDEGGSIERPEGWQVHPGSRIVIEEVDLLDANDVLWDHTFTEDELKDSSFDLSGEYYGQGLRTGYYNFFVALRLPEGMFR